MWQMCLYFFVYCINIEIIVFYIIFQRHALPLVDEFFVFLMYLALGSTEVDIADRFNVHQSTISRIITSWTYYLYFLLGSLAIWMSKEEIQAVLPKEFRESKYADTQVNTITLICVDGKGYIKHRILFSLHILIHATSGH